LGKTKHRSYLIETELAGTLERVTNEGGGPAESKAAGSLLGKNLTNRGLDTDLQSKQRRVRTLILD
jgi:hypothetical protein